MGFTNPYPASRLTVDSTNSLVTGLAAWFPLTEGEGTSAQCILHPSHVGTLVGGTNAGWANTDIGTAFDSNGSNSTGIDIPNSVVYSSPVSYSFWVYDAAGTGTRFVFDSDDVTDRQFAYINNSNNFAVGAGGTTSNPLISVPVNQWTHVVLVFDGSSSKSYKNGVFLTTFNPGSNGQGDFSIGYSPPNSGQFGWNGNVQNFRFYDRALSAAEVAILYHRPWEGSNYGDIWPYSPPAASSMVLSSDASSTSLMNSCLGWWPLTTGSGTVAKDIVGTNDGTLASSVTWESGTLGTATEYPSTPYEYTSTTLDLAGKSAVTVSAWIKNGGSSAGNGFGKIISQSHSGSFDTYMNKPSNASLAFDINSTVVMANNSDIPPIGTWFHVCFVWQQSTTQAIYINGELSNSGTADGSVIGTTSHDVFFGGTTDVYGNRPWDGGIQNVRIWDRALSSDEVAVLAERPWEGIEYGDTFHYDPPAPASMLPLTSDAINTNQVGWWPLTETDDYASGAADISGSSSTGTKSGGVTSQHSFTGASADFDNTGHIDVGKSFWDSGIVSANAFTFNAWFNVDNNTADHGIFGSWNSASEALIVWADVGGTNLSLTAICGDGTTQAITSVNAPIVTTGQWHMGTVIFDGSANTLKVYLDGVYSNENSSATATLTTAPMGFHIGDDGSTSRTTEGLIQNCRLWSRVLSADEIWSIYANPWLGSNYKLASGSTPLYNYIFRTERFRRLG